MAHSTESNLPQTRDLTSALEMTAGRIQPEPGLNQPGPASRRGGSPRPAACCAHSGISAPDLSQSQAATTGLAAHLPQFPEVRAIMPLNIPLSSCQPRSKLQARGGVGLLLKQDSIPLSCPPSRPPRGSPPPPACSGFMAFPCRQLVTMAGSLGRLQAGALAAPDFSLPARPPPTQRGEERPGV